MEVCYDSAAVGFSVCICPNLKLCAPRGDSDRHANHSFLHLTRKQSRLL